MTRRAEPRFAELEHRVNVEWLDGVAYPSLLHSERMHEATRAVLSQLYGIYVWRRLAKGFLRDTRHDLYVGQTTDGFLKRTSAHLKSNLGRQLKVAAAEFQRDEFYMVPALLRYQGPWDKKLRPSDNGLLLNTLENYFIYHLQPIWNTKERVRTTVPLTVRLTHTGNVPSGLQRIRKIEAGDYIRTK